MGSRRIRSYPVSLEIVGGIRCDVPSIDTGYQQVGDKLKVSNVRRVCHVFPCNSSVILFDFFSA